MALVSGLFVNDEKSSFLKTHLIQDQSEKTHVQFEMKMTKIDTIFLNKMP